MLDSEHKGDFLAVTSRLPIGRRSGQKVISLDKKNQAKSMKPFIKRGDNSDWWTENGKQLD
jgi:hypothetical protein